MMVRLAFRREGPMWNCYLAKAGTMENAKLLGSIILAPAERDLKIKEAFKDVMKMVMADAIREVTGKAPEQWTEERAPEAERSGHS